MQKASDIGPFAIVPEWLLLSGVSNDAIVLFAWLARHVNTEAECWPSYQRLAGLMGISRRHVIRLMQELERCGAVLVERRHRQDGGDHTNVYALRFSNPKTPVTQMSPPGDTDVTPPVTGLSLPPGDTDVTLNDNQVKERKPKERERTRAREKDAEFSRSPNRKGPPTNGLGSGLEGEASQTHAEATFERFLQAYPPPPGGMPSRQTLWFIWKDAELREYDLEAIVEGARRYRRFCEVVKDRPRQDPRNWLRNHEWERDWSPPMEALAEIHQKARHEIKMLAIEQGIDFAAAKALYLEEHGAELERAGLDYDLLDKPRITDSFSQS